MGGARCVSRRPHAIGVASGGGVNRDPERFDREDGQTDPQLRSREGHQLSHKSNVADYELIYRGETGMAIKVARDTGCEPFWLPKSQVEVDWRGKPEKLNTVVVVTIPDWLAEQEDLA
jgi:hypothetical protein